MDAYTHLMKAWFDNEEDLYEAYQTELKYGDYHKKEIRSIYSFADFLEGLINERKPKLKGVYEVLLKWALDKIVYEEIAKEFIDDYFDNIKGGKND